MHGLPGALGVTSTFPFVGRSAELDRLRTLLPRADARIAPTTFNQWLTSQR